MSLVNDLLLSFSHLLNGLKVDELPGSDVQGDPALNDLLLEYRSSERPLIRR